MDVTVVMRRVRRGRRKVGGRAEVWVRDWENALLMLGASIVAKIFVC